MEENGFIVKKEKEILIAMRQEKALTHQATNKSLTIDATRKKEHENSLKHIQNILILNEEILSDNDITLDARKPSKPIRYVQ